MIVGILKEQNDPRVALVPLGAKKIGALGADIWIESGAGDNSFLSDSAYEGVASIKPRSEIISNADMIISIKPGGDEVLSEMKEGATVISMFAPYNDETVVEGLKKYPLIAFSMDMIPRTSIAQSMDVLSSMASVAGYKAVLKALEHLPRYMPMMITAAGSIKPSKVLVLGAGVAGLQAIATARRLGAMVEAFDTRAAAKEEVKSLGAKFVEVEGATDDTSAGGYAVEQSAEFLKKQRALVQERAAQSDIVITTAQVRGRKAPLLVPQETLDKMKPGSVVVDLAASSGGNCANSKQGEVVEYNGVKIIGDSDLAADMPQDASTLFSNNVCNYLAIMIKEGKLDLDMENQIIRESMISSNSK